MNRRTTKKGLVSPQWALRQYHLTNPDLRSGVVFETRLWEADRIARRQAQEEADAQAKRIQLEEAEAKKKRFEEAEKARKEREEAEVKAKQENESASNIANEPSASVQKTSKDTLDNIHKQFQESLDTVRKENEEAAKQFADSIKSLLPGQANIESPDNINSVIDPYGSLEYNSTQKNTVESAVDREIRRQYGAEIDAYNQRLSEAEKYDAETNALIDERNANRVRTNYVNPSGENVNLGYEPHVDTAAQVRNQWENSDVYQKIQATRNYMLQNYTPNEALANKVLDFGSSDYNPAYVKASDYQNKLDAYKTAKAQYDEAVKALDNRREYFKGTRGINSQAFAKSISDEFGRLNAAVQLASEQLAIAEKDLDSGFTSKDKYEHDLQALSNSIRVNGLPKDKQKLTKYSQHVINSLGLMDVLYNPDGSLNEEFTGVGYASDEDIDNAAKAATNYFSSADFKSGTNDADEYLNRISDDIKLKKDMYQHLSQADVDASADERRQYSAQYRNLEKAEEILDKAKRHKYLNDIVKRADGFWTKQTATNIGYGVQEKLKDKGFWTLGLSELEDAIDKSKLADKINSGQELDQSEKSLASALAIEAVMHQNYGEYEKTMGYKAGQVATESMKFMAEMAATGGWSKALESSGRAAMKAAANRYVRKFGADGFKNILGRNLAKVPGLLRVIGGDAAYSMILANTLLAPSTVADVINLTTGDIVPEVQDGEITIGGYEGAKSLGRAVYEAEARAFTENMSEMIGEYGIGALLKYPFKYFGKQAVKNSKPLLGAYIAGSNAIDNAQKLINNMLPTKAISSFIKPVGSFIKAGHYSGIVGETAEEYYGNAMQHLLGVSEGTKIVVDENGQEKEVKTSFWEEIDPTTELGKQTFFDIVGGIALSTGFLGGGSALNYARIAHNYNKNKKRLIDLVGKDVVEKMETSLTQAHSSNIPATANTIIRGISNAAHREAFIDFYDSMMKFHGASQADQKIRESNDTDVFERAQRDAEINGYSVLYNTLRADLERAVDSIRSYAEQELGVEDGQLDQVIEDNGGAAEFISYLKSSGNDSMASIVMAYNNTRMQYEASMRRLMDDIDEDLANNERWVNRVSNERGKVIVGTTTSGQTVFVKSGTHIEDGQIKKDGKDLLVINTDGSVQTIDSKTVKDDFEEIDSNELKHDMDRQTYVSASEGLDFSKTSQKIGIQIQMSKGRVGTILNRTADGRIMYSVNDSSTNTEVVRITDPGVTEDQLIEEWANDYNTEFLNEQIKKAQSQLNQDYDKSAQIVATRELREYIRDVKERQRQDLESKHGKAIKYASGVLTKNTVDKVISDIDNARTPFIGEYVNIFNNAKVTVDASNWERLHRLIKAYKRGNISKKLLKEVLSDGSTNMSEKAKEDLQNMTVDRYGNVTWWKDQNDTNLLTHVDISEYDLNEEDLTESENLISESIKEEQKRLNSRQERKKRGEVGRKAAKERRAEQKKLRELEKAEKRKQQQAKLPKKVAEQVSKHVEPAPMPTPGDITNFVVNKPEFLSLQNAVNKLQRQADWTSANVLRDQTTSHNYFIMIDGKRVMFTRVHGVLDDLYEHIAEDAVVEANKQRLLNVYNTSGIDALKSEILSMMKQGGVEDQSLQYITYLDENPDAYLDVIDGVSNVSAPRTIGPSVTFGQYVDTLCRLFFNGETITLDTQLEDDSYVKDHMDQKTLDKFIDQCKQLKSIYDALGWQLMSNRTVFTYNVFDKSLGKNVNVAGETDMIAVDRLGNYHIIDFKTSYKAFDSFINGNGDVINLFESIPAPYKGNKAKRSTKELYTNQLTMYSMMVESTLNGTVDSIEIMPFRLDYDANRLWFRDIENHSRVLNNAKTGKYGITIPQRIILTKSGELINRFTQDSAEKEVQQKKDIEDRLKELLAQINELPTDDLTSALLLYVESTCDQMRDDINKMLSGMPNLSPSEYEQINQLIRSIQLKYEDISSYISAQALDNKLNRLEEAKMQEAAQQNMLSYDALLQQQASAETKWAADWKAAFEQDYQTLVYLCKYMSDWAKEHNNSYVVQPELMLQFNQLVSNLLYMIDFDNEVLGTTSGRILSLDYNTISKVERCINWVHTHITDVVPVLPIVPPESPKEYQNAEKPWQSTNGLYKDKFRDSNGVSSSTAIDDDTLLLSAVTKNADFVDNSEFRVLTSNGKLYIQITYGGHTYTPVAFFSAHTENGRKLNNRMFQALRSANSNQKVILTGGVKRSFGEFIVKEGGQYKTAHEQGMIAFNNDEPGVNIYDIEYSSTSSTIGITYTREIQNGSNKVTVTEVRVPSSEDAAKLKFERQMQNAGWVTDKNTGAKRRMVPDSPYALAFGSAIYTYSNVNQNRPRSGVFVFMHNLGYTDDPTCCVPVTMRHSFISKNDASFIIDALLGKYNGLIKKRTGVVSANNPLGFSTTSTEFVKGFGGNVVIGGLTIDVKISDIVDLIIPVKGCPSYESQLRRQDPTQRMPIYMNLDNVNETGEVLIVGNVEGDGIDTMQRSFNIRTNSGIQALEDFLQKVERNMNMNGFAQTRLGKIGSISDQYGYPMPLSNSPAGGVSLKDYVKKHGSLQFGNSCVRFDAADFSNPAVQGDNNGITGIAWYLKNGFLECMYNGTTDPLIRIEDDAQVSVVDENPIETQQPVTTKKEEAAITKAIENAVPEVKETDIASILQQELKKRNSSAADALNSMADGFYKQQLEAAKNPISKEKAMANLIRILGKDVPVEFIPQLVAVSKAGARYVGICEADAITLSYQAEEGTEYHEAFHRVMEVLFTPEQRKKAYDKFRSAKPGRLQLTDGQIAEIFADEFMYYAMNQPVVKLHWNVIKMWREIIDWCKMWRSLGSWNIFRLYAKINSGQYANLKPDLRSLETFKQRAGGKGFFYTANGHEFEHIVNSIHYKKLLNFIAMSFMHNSVQKINIDGSNLDQFKLDLDLLLKKQRNPDSFVEGDTSIEQPVNFFTIAMANAPESTYLALKEMIDNFDAIKPDLAAYISLFASDYKVRYEEQNNSKKEGVDTVGGQFDDIEPTTSEEDITGSWIDNHIKESYEFAPITRTTQKTKFFFSGIPKRELTDDGWRLKLNELELPEMYDMQYAYITVLNEVSNCRSIPDLYNKLLEIGENDDLFNFVANKFGKLWNKVLSGNANADEKALVTLIFTLIKSTTSEFMLAKSTNKNGEYDVQLEKTDQSYRAKQYVDDWAQSFAVGGCKFFKQAEDGLYKMNGSFKPDVFLKLSELIISVVDSANKDDLSIIEANRIKQQLCICLNMLGVTFTTDMLNIYLRRTYNDTNKDGLVLFFNDEKNNINGFCKKLNALVYKDALNITDDGRVDAGNKPSLDKYFANDNFLSRLADAKYMWHRAHDLMSVLIANNAKAYTKSENNLITDRLDEIMYDEEVQHQLMSDPYNYNSENNTGSILLKNRGAKLRFVTMGGFKTDEYGNTGIDYVQQSKREDWIGKAVALTDGYILGPTMSDKKSWGFIDGLRQKMLEFAYDGTDFSNSFINGITIDENGNVVDLYIPDTVLNQMLEYAYCENASIKHVLDQIVTDELGNKKWLIPEDKLVENFHNGKTYWVKDGKVYEKKEDAPEGAIEVHPVQGARYTSLLGVYENGTFVEFNQLVDENGNYKDELANYNTAQEKFFSKSPEEQKRMLREILLNRVREELKLVEDLGLILRQAVDGNTRDSLFTYKNTGLPVGRIRLLEDKIKSAYDSTLLSVDQLNTIHSLAIVAYITDITNRHIISMQEFERMFSGNPAFFKFGYDSKGHLIDRTVDQSKRLGGLVSTGTNNCLDIPGTPTEYTCVEVDNPMMVAAHIELVQKDVYDGEIRSAYLRHLLEENDASLDNNTDIAEEIASNVDAMSIEEIEEAMKDMPLLGIAKKIAESKIKKLKKVDIADGAAYVTDEMCENLLKMVGSWSKEIEEAFQILRGIKKNPKTGKPYSVADTRATGAYAKIYTSVIGAQKYTAYGYRFQDGLAVPYYNKMALFPMFKNMCTGNMAKLYNAVKAQGVDMIMINSAVKVGSQAKYDLKDWDNIDFTNHKYKLKYAYLRKQFNTDPKEKELMSVGTQMTKIVMSSMIAGRSYNVNGQMVTATQVRNDIMTAINKLSDYGKQQIFDKFFKDGQFDIELFSNTLKDELSSRGATKESIAACDVENGEMLLSLDAMSSSNWILSILVAMINKQVVDINMPGSAFYQRSSWGMEGETSIIGDDNLPPSINNGNKLEVLNEDGSMDCVLSIDFFANILKGTNAEHADFESQRAYLIRKGIIGPTAKANMIAYRIPTQAISSIHALRCVDVIPTVRDTVILPAEITAITGSDYDIDKMFISMKHYRRIVDEERSKDGKVHHITTDVFDENENPAEYWCNKLIDNYLALLKDKRSFNQLNGPIDSDTELLTSIVKDLEEGGDKPILMPYLASTLSFLATTKDQFVTGKTGIGPFALNNNNHILTMLYGVKFKEDYSVILTRLGLTDLSSSTDRDGKSIMSWLSGLINAHVDVAKDPYISRLNVNSYTYNLVNLLVRTGLGKTTFYFTTQPIMKQLASVYNTASGVYMIEEGLTKSQAQRRAIDDAIVAYVTSNTGTQPKSKDAAIDSFKKDFEEKHGINADDAIVRLFEKDCDVLHSISKRGKVEDLQTKKDEMYTLQSGVLLSLYEVQMLVIIANDLFKDPAQQLSDVVKYSKIDTKKLGKNVAEVEIYKKGVNRTFDENGGSLVFENIDKLYKDSYIKTKTDNAIDVFEQILRSVSISATDLFILIVNSIMHLNPYREVDVKMLNTIIKSVLAQVKSRFFFDSQNGYCAINGIGKKSLIDGKESIYNRLVALKAQIMSLPEYADYRDSSGEPINYLLRTLVSGYTTSVKNGVFNSAKFVQIPSIVQSDEIDPDEITTAWDALLHDNLHPELQKFARDLVVYAMLTSADNGGNKDIFKYVPNSWKVESGYAQYMRDALLKFQKGTYDWTNQDTQDVILNNISDNFFTRKVNLNKVTVLNSSDGIPSVVAGVRIENSVRIVDGKRTYIPSVTFTYPDVSLAPDYIKTTHTDDYGNVTEYVYAKTDEGIINNKRYPIYTRINPRTTVFKAGNRVYGYGTRAAVSSIVNSQDFLTKVIKQLGAVRTTVDADGQVTSAAQLNMELAIYESYQREKLAQKQSAAPQAPIEKISDAGNGYINHSGGAIGSDSYWDEVGQQYGVVSNHYYHGKKTPKGNVELTDAEFNEGKKHVLKANETLHRKPEIYMDLLARNYNQVKNADAIFAIGHLKNGIVDGGTGWAVQMAIDDGKPVYVYDQERKQWYKNINGVWSESSIPTLTKNFAGIGTRGLNESGKQAIRDVYNNTFNQQQSDTEEFYTKVAVQDYIDTLVLDGVNRDDIEVRHFPETDDEDEYWTVTVKQQRNGSNEVINIYAGTGENADLSNFTIRPFRHQFRDRSYKDFQSVEQAFQFIKAYQFADTRANDGTARNGKSIESEIMETTNGAKLRLLGRSIKELNTQAWDRASSAVMKELLRESFELNPQALQRLLATGNATLTHTQDKGKWGTEFPRLLMEVREELRNQQNNTFDDSDQSDAAMKKCKD